MNAAQPQHVSPNRLEGSLGDTPLEQLLHECHKHLVTGAIEVHTRGRSGAVELRVGYVDTARFGELADDDAVDAMRELRDGEYELIQRLPDLAGELGAAAQLEGDTSELSLVALMRHCEDNALSCIITIVSGFDRGQIRYRAGEIVEVELNGRRDDDKIVDMVRFEDARFRVSAPPLDLAISGWPSVRRAPTAPVVLERDEPSAPESPAAEATNAEPRPDAPTDDVFPAWLGLALVLLATAVAGVSAWTLFLY